MIREFLRARRKAKRIAADEARDALLTEERKAEYLAMLKAECARSSLIAALEVALAQPGDVVECGVFRGASLRRIAATVKERAPGRTVFGLDSFEGFPDDGITDADTQAFRGRKRLLGKFKDADDAPARLDGFARAFDIDLVLKKGYFEHTLPDLAGRKLSFLHIDCDTYAGHVEVLGALFDQVVSGGMIALDDYRDPAWPGATQAVDEFLADRPERVELSEVREDPAWIIRKL